MTESYDARLSDSAWLAPMVAQAFSEGRYELGAALARLTVQAERMEKAAAPAVGSASLPIYEDVNRTGTVYAHQHVQTPGEGAHDDAPKELPQAATLPTEGQKLPTVPTARCIALVGGNGSECHGVIYWVVASQQWTHLDPSFNTHEPFPDRAVEQ